MMSGDRPSDANVGPAGAAGSAAATAAAAAIGVSRPSAWSATAFSGLGVLLEVMRILETQGRNVGANRHTQVVGFSEQDSSEQIEKRGQLATMRRAFR